MIYIIGSLRNPEVPVIANTLRVALDEEVFSSWFCASENADDRWQQHEQGRGLTYIEALKDYAAQQVFTFDKTHLNRARAVVLVYKAGRSGHLELGYAIGRGIPGYVLLDEEPERWDVMLNFADGVFSTAEDLITELTKPVSITTCIL